VVEKEGIITVVVAVEEEEINLKRRFESVEINKAFSNFQINEFSNCNKCYSLKEANIENSRKDVFAQ